MPNWRTIEETDLAANVSQSEIDAYRADGALDGSDPVRQLLVSTVDAVRGYISCNGSVRMGPSGTIPRGLVIPAMDYAMGKVLNRIGVPLSEDRREALRKAQELFEKISKGEITPESYSEDGEIDESTRPATSPIADDGPRRTLGGGLWSIAAALLAVLSASAKTFDVDISTGRPAASNEAFYHGETVEFRAVRGRTAVTNIEYSCVYYQTNGMDQAWWKTDGLVFHPTNDCGAAAYRFFLEGRDEIGRDWHANGLLRFLPSPGFEPSAVQLPVQTLDFSKVTVLNPPWGDTDLTPATNYTDEAIATQSAAQSAALAAATNALSAALSAADAVVARDATNYTDSVSAALSAAKQDKLPYSTNAIPQGVISGLAAALAGKLDKTGGTMTGSVQFNSGWTAMGDMSDTVSVGQDAGDGYVGIGETKYRRTGIRTSYGNLYFPADSGTFALTSDIPAVDLTDATNYTDEVAGDLSTAIAGKYPNASGNQLAQQVAAIGAHLNGEDARFVVTNYDSVVHTPEAYVEIKVSNDWLRVWDEGTRWNKYETWKTNVDAELSFKADRAWGVYDSETGGYSPAGFTQVSSSNILIAAGMAYQRTVTSAGSVWVLQCNQGVAQVSGDTNGFFRVKDSDGVTQFEIIKGDKREIGCDASGITLSHDTPPVVTVPYSVVSGEHPSLYITESIDAPDWKKEGDENCIATVTWGGSSGAWVATVNPKQNYASMFIRATYEVGGETYIRNNAPVGMDSIILNGVKYYLGTATISGHTVLTLSTTAP